MRGTASRWRRTRLELGLAHLSLNKAGTRAQFDDSQSVQICREPGFHELRWKSAEQRMGISHIDRGVAAMVSGR